MPGGEGGKDACDGDSGGPLVVKVSFSLEFKPLLKIKITQDFKNRPRLGRGGQFWHWLWKKVSSPKSYLAILKILKTK